MKHTILKKVKSAKLLAILLLTVVSVSCSDDDEVANLGNLQVQLELASELGDISLEGVDVSITNTVDNSSFSLSTDATGSATFSNISVGSSS